MITIKYFDWQMFEALSKTLNFKKYKREDIQESILDDSTRVKRISYKKFIVLGKSHSRKHFFSVLHINKKFTVSPIFVRLMNEKEKDHFDEYQYLD